MPKPTVEFTSVSSPAFVTESNENITTRILAHDDATNDKTVILIHRPGSSWGEPVCSHDYWEECYIIEGRLFDATLQKWFDAGSYCCRPPGMLHGPYQADANIGCKEICWIKYTGADDRTEQTKAR